MLNTFHTAKSVSPLWGKLHPLFATVHKIHHVSENGRMLLFVTFNDSMNEALLLDSLVSDELIRESVPIHLILRQRSNSQAYCFPAPVQARFLVSFSKSSCVVPGISGHAADAACPTKQGATRALVPMLAAVTPVEIHCTL